MISIDYRDLTEQCYEVLKQMILTRQFEPDEKLSVDRMATLLGVSRTPAKDAINRLANDGLLIIRPRVGTFVAPVTIQDIREVFEIRYLVEMFAAEQGIALVTPSQIEKMRDVVAKMANCIENGRYHPDKFDTFLTLDSELHEQIVALARNGRLLTMYKSLKVSMHIARVYYVKETSNAMQGQIEHEQIVQAYANQDVDTLKQILGQHISTVKTQIVANLKTIGGVL